MRQWSKFKVCPSRAGGRGELCGNLLFTLISCAVRRAGSSPHFAADSMQPLQAQSWEAQEPVEHCAAMTPQATTGENLSLHTSAEQTLHLHSSVARLCSGLNSCCALEGFQLGQESPGPPGTEGT